MAYVQVKNTLQMWKLAAFIVAFFSSFFSYSADLDYSSLPSFPPKNDISSIISCSDGSHVSEIEKQGQNFTSLELDSFCVDIVAEELLTHDLFSGNGCSAPSYTTTVGTINIIITISYTYFSYNYCQYEVTKTFSVNSNVVSTSDIYTCPPDDNPSYTQARDLNDDGEIDNCYHFEDIQALINDADRLDKNDDYCESLILDTGSNTADNACYSAPNGSQCNVSKVSGTGYSYYQGTNNEALGCGSSENAPYDMAGTGDEKDSCIFSDGVNYCEANKTKHCSDNNGVTTCDNGCIESGDIALCDTSKHPDVGEGESDYFNDNGTCSVIAASSSKGFCAEMGGVWDDSTNYMATSCPVGSGSCSTGASICGACMDEGGIWTPDANAQTDINALNDVAKRIDDGNIKLKSIENSTRKSGEAITSTIKSGNGKIIAALEELTKITQDKPEVEKETFTTTTAPTNKTGINSLFDTASISALQSENTAKVLSNKNLMKSIISEGTSIFTITAVSSTGYQARNLALSQGTFDVSLSRFSYFFSMLAAPIMLIASVYSALIILGKNS